MGTTIIGGILSGGGSGGVVAEANHQYFTAIAGQTVFSLSSVNTNAAMVFINGVKLLSSDYTLTSSQLTLNNSAALNDEICVIDWTSDGNLTVSGSSGGGGIQSTQTHTATAGQTVFSLSPTINASESIVFVNGVIIDSSDYTLTNSQLTLGFSSVINDEIIVVDFGTAAASGASDFISLSDTPSSFSGQANKYVAVNGSSDSLIFVNAPTGGSGGTGVSLEIPITSSNSFSIGDVIYASGSTFAKSDASDPLKSEVLGIVNFVTSNNFRVTTHGQVNINSHGYTLGSDLFLSETVGEISDSDVVATSSISKPIGSVIDANNIHVNILRGSTGAPIAGASESWTVVSGTVSAVAGGYYFLSPSDTLNFPSSPSDNDVVVIAQGSGDLATTSATVSGGTKNISDNINPDSTTWLVDDNFTGRFTFVFNSTLDVWKVT